MKGEIIETGARQCAVCKANFFRQRRACGDMETPKEFARRKYCGANCRKQQVYALTEVAQRRVERRLAGHLVEHAAVVKWEPFVYEAPIDTVRCWAGQVEGYRCVLAIGHYRPPGPDSSPHQGPDGKMWFGRRRR